ncbi:uncharacterized protein VTP21DRAFT_4654 [Calcarisporiella thermophila]|uniref:uncharacterized protein n=1 Tax=Calcarisporiella thermophila TaxID=911321 RepID=UPI003742DA2F
MSRLTDKNLPHSDHSSGSYYIHECSFVDLDERRRAALAEIDNSRFGWYHLRACIILGMGFFTDSYSLFIIDLVGVLLAWTYFSTHNLPTSLDIVVKMSALLGVVLGQIMFGWLADHAGRKKVYGIEILLIIIATLGQSLSGSSLTLPIWAAIAFWRVVLGIGIGGDYPLSAIITSEFATASRRGAMVAAVFVMQGFGILAASIVSITLLFIYHEGLSATPPDPASLEMCWRLLIGLGAIPAVASIYFRFTIPETPRFTMDVEGRVTKGAKDATAFLARGTAAGDYDEADLHEQTQLPKASLSDFVAYFRQWKNGKIFLGTAVSWLLLDVTFYGLSLNSSLLLEAVGFTTGENVTNTLYYTSLGNIIICLLGGIPGYWTAVFTMDKLGRRTIQLIGFGMLAVIYIIMGALFTFLSSVNVIVFLFLFILVQFFYNFGPNATTFIIPSEIFPTRYRCLCYGISATSGKLAAIFVQVGISHTHVHFGFASLIDKLFIAFGCLMFVGFLITLALIPETKGKTLEELSNEVQYDFVVQSHQRRVNGTAVHHGTV